MSAKIQGLIAIEYLNKSLAMYIADRTMKETGPYCAIGLYYSGNPRRVAARGYPVRSPELRAEVTRNSAKLIRTLYNKPGFDVF